MDVEEKAQMGLDLNSTGQPLQGLSGIVTVKPATVSGNNPEAEVGVIAEQQWRGIQERGATGMSVAHRAGAGFGSQDGACDPRDVCAARSPTPSRAGQLDAEETVYRVRSRA
ncbi:MAG: hypothetical protein U1F35_18000 [Steroidobacteraceae bacterium]